MIKAICTDFGGVLFPIQPYLTKPDPEKFQKLKQTVIDIYNKREADILDRSYTIEQFKIDLTLLENDFSSEQLETVYRSIVEINKPLISLYNKYSQKIRVCALVNEAPKWTEFRVYFHNLQNLFSNIYISAYTGYKKPDIRAYKVMLDKEKLKPSEVVFIDDGEDNIKTAIDLGFNPISYKTFEKTEAEIVQFLSSSQQ